MSAVRPYTWTGQYEFMQGLDIVTWSGAYSTCVQWEEAVRVQATCTVYEYIQFDENTRLSLQDLENLGPDLQIIKLVCLADHFAWDTLFAPLDDLEGVPITQDDGADQDLYIAVVLIVIIL
eukprot:SAG11_NODE_24603_length_370_cov_22.712177_1_plen_120_part_01